MPDGENRKLRLGVAGLGRAFTVMLPALARDPRIVLAGAAEPRAEPRVRFAAEFSAPAHETIEALCADASIDAVYIATPHQHHAAHAQIAAQHGKHLLIEKPMALTLDDCAAMIEAARKAGVQLVVGHSHSFDAPIARALALIESGEFGRVRMITALNYTDFLYRPRRPEELDSTKGGGAVFNQAAHQVDIVRLLGGGRVATVRAATGAWDRQRPTEGAYAALLTFEDGAFATLGYNGYGHFDSDEFMDWTSEMGRAKSPGMTARHAKSANAEEIVRKYERSYGGAAYQAAPDSGLAHQHFGMVVVSCEHADLRPLPTGVMIYRDGAARLDPLPPPRIPRAEVVDEFYNAVVHGIAPLHDGAWAMATQEVILAMLRSAREGGDVRLRHQVGLR